MTHDLRSKSATTDLVELKKIFGPPPVLSTESSDAYDAIMTRLFECIRPEDFVEQMFVKDLTNYQWEIMRYMRHKTLMIERKFRHPPRPMPRNEWEAQNNRLLAVMTAQLNRKTTGEPKEAQELDHAKGLEDGIEYFERLDKLLNAAVGRRNDCLDQITQYRADLGQHLRQASNAIIDAEFKTVDDKTRPTDVPLVPIKDETQ